MRGERAEMSRHALLRRRHPLRARAASSSCLRNASGDLSRWPMTAPFVTCRKGSPWFGTPSVTASPWRLRRCALRGRLARLVSRTCPIRQRSCRVAETPPPPSLDRWSAVSQDPASDGAMTDERPMGVLETPQTRDVPCPPPPWVGVVQLHRPVRTRPSSRRPTRMPPPWCSLCGETSATTFGCLAVEASGWSPSPRAGRIAWSTSGRGAWRASSCAS